MPSSDDIYQVAYVCTDTQSYTTGLFKRQSNDKVSCSNFRDNGNFADPCIGDGNKMCCI